MYTVTVGPHDDVIKWKHFPRYWPFVRGIHRSSVNSPHKGQWRGALMFSLVCVWINGWVNNREAGDLRRYSVHCDVIVMPGWPRSRWICYRRSSCALRITWACISKETFKRTQPFQKPYFPFIHIHYERTQLLQATREIRMNAVVYSHHVLWKIEICNLIRMT